MESNDVIAEMIGWEPGLEERKAILKAVEETGKSLQEIIGEGKTIPHMPEMAILGTDGRFEYKGQRITASEWEQINPLGKFGKIVIVGTKKRVELHRSLCNVTK